jgi:predicted nucleic acid-binding protein
MRAVIVDTGPLVAFFDRAERHHRWVAERIEELQAPLLICEAVLAEAMYLLARLSVAFHVEEHVEPLRKLLQKYRDTPMSLADACVVRMAEIYDRHDVLTLDSDFSVYRKHGRIPLTLIRPPTIDADD